MRNFRVLFISLTDDTGCERFPLELMRYGVDCASLSPPGFQCTNIGALTLFRLPAHRGLWIGALGFSTGLARAVAAFAPDLLVPLDDLAAWLLRGLSDTGHLAEPLATLIQRSTGAPAGHAAARWRIELMNVAREVGIPVPPYRAVKNASALMEVSKGLEYPVVVKEENSCGGRGVLIARSRADLRHVFEPALRVSSLHAWMKRARGFARRVTWARAGASTALWRSILLQGLIVGRPALCTVVADAGKMLESVCFVTEQNHPRPTGASTVVRFIAHDRMENYAARLVRRLGYSGLISFDFILSPDESDATLIEMNARPVGTVHLGRLFGRDLCAATLRLLDRTAMPARRPQAIETRMIALFPKELERDPGSFIHGVPDTLIHDVPWQERAVMIAYGHRLARLHPTRAAEIWRQIGLEDDVKVTSPPVAGLMSSLRRYSQQGPSA